MSDVDLSVGADTSLAAQGFAALKNYAEKARSDIASTFASAIAFTGLVAGVQSVIDKMHELAHESERFGIDPEQLQLISNAAQQEGISIEQVARAMNLVEIAGVKATDSTSKQAAALQQLGIAATYFASLSPDQKILAISEAWVAGSKTGEDYAAVATLIGQRFGTELIPLLEKGPEGIKAISEAMGIASDSTVRSLDEAYKTWQTFGNEVTVWGAEIVAFLVNNLTAALFTVKQGFIAAAEAGSALFTALEQAATGHLSDAWNTLTSAQSQITGEFKSGYKNIYQGKDAYAPQTSAAELETPTARALAAGGTGEEGTGLTGLTDVSARSGGLGGGGGGGGSAEASANKLISLRERIAKIEEDTAGKNRSDEEQLAALQQRRVDLTNAMLTAYGEIDGKEADEKTKLQATLALAETNAEYGKLSAKIEQDKADAAAKVTKEREKEAYAAQQNLADSQEQNKELELQLSGREDLADRAKIEYDYEQKIKDAKDAKATAEAQGFDDVAATNQALIEQLTLEEKNALAAHDKAEAEKQAQATAEAGKQLEGAERGASDAAERNKELALELSGHKEAADSARIEYEFQQKITDARAEQNDLWAQSAQAYAEGNTAAGDELAQAAQLKDVEIEQLDIEQQQTEALKDQTDERKKGADIARGILGDTGQTRTLGGGQRVEGYDQFGRPVVKSQGGGSDLTIGDLASMGLRMDDIALGLSLLPGGKIDQQRYQKYSALEQIQRLTGKDPFSFVDRANANAALTAEAQRQQRIATAQAKTQEQNELTYWQDIYAGVAPPSSNPFTTQYGAVPRFEFSTPSVPATGGGNVQIAQLQSQITIMQQQLQQLQLMNQKLTPKPGG